MGTEKTNGDVPPGRLEYPAPVGVEEGKDVSTRNRTWRSYLWDTWDKTPEERWLVHKIDLTLVLFGCLGTFNKFLDKANLQTAFVSGMKEDLELYGNELNYANTAYNVGMILALWPSNLVLTRTPPRYFIPFIMIGWTICTFISARMRGPTDMYILRTFVGIFETGHYSAVMYLCGSWYQKAELTRRLALVNTASQFGPMIGAYLQAAAHTHLNGVQGMAGWRWLFIIDGVISIAIAIPQIFILPEVPSRLVPNFMFSAAEVEMARDRQPKEGRVVQGAFTKAQVRRWFTTPEIWILWVISVCNMIGMQPSLSLSFWFKAWNSITPGSFTVAQINDYTTPMYAVILVTTVGMAWISDTFLKGRRWPMMVFGCSINFVVCILLAATPTFPKNKAFRWFLYYNSGWGEASNCMFWAWTSEILAGDPATRAFALAGLNVWAAVFAATLPLAVFKTVDQPTVRSGNYTAAGFHLLQVVSSLGLAYMVYEKKRRSPASPPENDAVSSESASVNNTVVEEHFPKKDAQVQTGF